MLAFDRWYAKGHKVRNEHSFAESGVSLRCQSDGELILRASKGDQPAWDALVDRYAGLVWRVAKRIGLSDSDAADVSQVTWLRLVQHLDAIRDPDRLGAWLTTTARREATHVSMRATQRTFNAGDMSDYDSLMCSPPVEDKVVERSYDPALHEALATLPPRYVTLLLMLASDERLTYQEIATRMNLPVGSIGPMRGRALDLLRRRLKVRARQAQR
jgi:RNA polymerase sigma factor (sigma-70 family)